MDKLWCATPNKITIDFKNSISHLSLKIISPKLIQLETYFYIGIHLNFRWRKHILLSNNLTLSHA